MLMKEILGEQGDKRIVGRDIRSAFNGLRKEICVQIFEAHEGLKVWIAEFLRPRACTRWVIGTWSGLNPE